MINEFQIGRMISHPSFRKSINRSDHCGKKSLELEWVNGHSLNVSWDKRKHSINDFLLIAREIVSALVSMHKQRTMRLNLCCEHIIYEEKSNVVIKIR